VTFLLGAALAQVEEEVTVIPDGLGGESFPVKKRSVEQKDVVVQLEQTNIPMNFDFASERYKRKAETKDVVIKLQMEPFDFNFDDVTPMRLKRALNAKKFML
ncbi:hypothetical protein JJB28_10010, partial [Campylobacter fetus subsp. venerealis]|uniref:hypothetical protein n=1 Tax=Campylobacter fetus TaxID=196 RepID=UPI00190C170C